MSETFEFGVGTVKDDIESRHQLPLAQPPLAQPPLVQHNDDASSVTSDGVNTKFIIDNLSPTWGIMLTVQDNLNLRIGMQLKKNISTRGFGTTFRHPSISQLHCSLRFLPAKLDRDPTS